MKKSKKSICAAVFVCIFLLAATASAQTIPAERLLPRLVDGAGLLTEAEAAELLEKLDEISERQKCDVAVVTVDSLEGKRSDAYADDFYDYNGYGYGPGHNGILLLVCMGERDWAISTHGFAVPAFTDAGQEYMADWFAPELRAGSYRRAFDLFAQLCDEFLTRAKDGAPYDIGRMPDTVMPFSFASFKNLLPFSLAVGVVLSLVITSAMKAKLKSVRSQPAAGSYLRAGSLNITESRDVFLYKTVSKRARSTSSGGGGRGGSSTRISSSGRTHGGSRGKF